MFSIIFLILWLLGIVHTDYDWLIFALFVIADSIQCVPKKIIEKVKGD